MVAKAKLYTEVELDQIRADAAEEARKAAGEWLYQQFGEWMSSGEGAKSFERRIRQEFGL